MKHFRSASYDSLALSLSHLQMYESLASWRAKCMARLRPPSLPVTAAQIQSSSLNFVPHPSIHSPRASHGLQSSNPSGLRMHSDSGTVLAMPAAPLLATLPRALLSGLSNRRTSLPTHLHSRSRYFSQRASGFAGWAVAVCHHWRRCFWRTLPPRAIRIVNRTRHAVALVSTRSDGADGASEVGSACLDC